MGARGPPAAPQLRRARLPRPVRPHRRRLPPRAGLRIAGVAPRRELHEHGRHRRRARQEDPRHLGGWNEDRERPAGDPVRRDPDRPAMGLRGREVDVAVVKVAIGEGDADRLIYSINIP